MSESIRILQQWIMTSWSSCWFTHAWDHQTYWTHESLHVAPIELPIRLIYRSRIWADMQPCSRMSPCARSVAGTSCVPCTHVGHIDRLVDRPPSCTSLINEWIMGSWFTPDSNGQYMISWLLYWSPLLKNMRINMVSMTYWFTHSPIGESTGESMC